MCIEGIVQLVEQLIIKVCCTQKHTKSAFIHDRFTHWKKAIEKFREHEASNMQVDKLLKLYLTFPVTISTAKCSFSSLRHIITYLREVL